ncbi:hypothetical protein PR202_ga12079 [Eleusine coracana subsp. coracana]|uniref:Uncharacterized protein n=1 Tax=Eleusine coracana subsp. coracana TaxID=191504 RepID=A0AAV5CB63_ELECO|nr:hypothetical protein QOZ80_5AG0395170 [Eleusine coracana subsp. coracana]GJM95356.1 hypothetical protein PR202_ga12079 [Eleusine coracana subsp. coracana]
MRRTGVLPRGRSAAASMGRARKVMRASVSAFFDGYHCFTSVAALLALPFSAAALAASAAAPSSALLHGVAFRLRAVFAAAGFPSDSAFFSLLEAKLSQTVAAFAFALPFSLTFLLLAKAAVAAMLRDDDHSPPTRRRRLNVLPPCAAVARAYPALVATHLFNAFVMLSANAAAFSLLLLGFGAADLLGVDAASRPRTSLALSAAGAAVYSLAIGVATVVCNLAAIAAAMERGRLAGHAAALRACVLIRGRVSTALALALPTNLAMAAAEALFQLRVVAQRQRDGGRLRPGVAGEAFSIAYIHALCVVLEIVVGCMFYRSCTKREADEMRELEPEEKGDFQA